MLILATGLLCTSRPAINAEIGKKIMRTKTNVKAGGLNSNHNEKLLRA